MAWDTGAGIPPPLGIGVAVFCIYTRFHISDRRYLCHA
nr:MAG TPA: resistance to inhibitors of cholinesterase-like protein [Caudoviricetes sp.]DAQ50095.1 MAG TPA: resistance to inhibitors of cholinesterase-like protein [Caudoviricetes sp.]